MCNSPFLIYTHCQSIKLLPSIINWRLHTHPIPPPKKTFYCLNQFCIESKESTNSLISIIKYRSELPGNYSIVDNNKLYKINCDIMPNCYVVTMGEKFIQLLSFYLNNQIACFEQKLNNGKQNHDLLMIIYLSSSSFSLFPASVCSLFLLQLISWICFLKNETFKYMYGIF